MNTSVVIVYFRADRGNVNAGIVIVHFLGDTKIVNARIVIVHFPAVGILLKLQLSLTYLFV